MSAAFLLVTVMLSQQPNPAAKVVLPAADNPISLKKGDRIVFFGDSITAGGTSKTGYITLMRDHLTAQHMDLGLQLIGAGVSGNKVPDLQNRVDRDVIARKPTIVFIYIGINDVWHSDFGKGTPKDRYEAGLKEIIGKIQKAGARVALCTPSVIGEKPDGSNRHDASLDEYAAVSRAVAKEMKANLCDLRKGFLAQLKVNNPNKKDAGILTSDRVHLNPAGNKLVAEMMLNYLGETLSKPLPAPAKPNPQDKKKGAAVGKGRSITMVVGDSVLVGAVSNEKIREASAAKVNSVRLEGVDNPYVVRVVALAPGQTQVNLVPENGPAQVVQIDVVVRKEN